MNLIESRRSIRRFKTDVVSREQLEKIIKAGISAPSAKNRQPWRFVVVSGSSKETALHAMEQGIQREKIRPFLTRSAILLRDAEHTLEIMKQAPAVIFIINSLGKELQKTLSVNERVFEICNTLSIGAAIENMSLAAVELELGTLWICNTFFAFPELTEALHTKGVMYAALAVGYPDEAPLPRPRRSIDDVTEWRD